LPPDKSFEFIIEKEKRDKIRRVVFHNDGEVLSETVVDNDDLRIKIRKIAKTDV